MLTDSKINKIRTPQFETVFSAMLLSTVHTSAVQHHIEPVTGPQRQAGKKEAGAGFVPMVALGSLRGLLCMEAPMAQLLGLGPSGASLALCLFFCSKQLLR